MASYPAGYNADPVLPLVVIKDIAGVEQFRWEPDQLVAVPPGTRNFTLESWSLHGGINTDHGMAELLIDDRNNLLTETTNLNREVKIKNGWELIIQLGKSDTTLNTWFVGVIQEPELIRPSAKLQQILITASGWGVLTAHRISRMQRFQKKLADGLGVDTTDTNAKVSEIFKDVLVDTDHLAHTGLGQIGIGVVGVGDIDVKLPDYQRSFQTFGVQLSELSNIGGGLYGIDATKDAFLRRRGGTDSGFLISNHLESGDLHFLLTKNWDQLKTMFLRNERIGHKDTTIGFGYTHIHGVGAQHATIDIENTAANAIFDLNTNNLAIPFTPTKDNVAKIALFLSKVGVVDKNLHVCIIGEDGAAEPNVDDLRKRVVIDSQRLEREITTGGIFFEISFDKISISVREKLFIQIDKYPDAGELRIDFQTGTGAYFTDADKVPPWTSNVGDMKIRTYHARTMHIISTNTVSAKKLRTKETTFSLVDFPDEDTATRAMESLSDVYGKKKRIYSPLLVSPPTNLLDMGKTLRLLDKFNGLDQTVDIVGYNISGSAYNPQTALGANEMTIFVEDLHL